ncbi:MAG TPA: hypothetical protein VFY51_05425 [Pyrinomonadaceae bacterium]|nr:hypothetical protein [Pyrinomonadaceae bacterium]
MRFLHIAFLFVVLTVAAFAQAPDKAAADKAATDRVRRQQARALLIALSTDARAFHDQTLRARSLARIADALWTVDGEQARLMFRKSWEAAEVADRESEQKLQEQIKQQQAKTGRSGYAVSLPPSLRREVLRLAARKDRTLGEEFLEKLKAEKAEAATNAKLNPGKLNESLEQRLGVARELMETGDMERALQFADPVLTTVSMETMDFLVNLRKKDPLSADKRFAAMLSSSTNNPQADANTVSLLTSYIFTPGLYMVFQGTGMSTSQMASTFTAVEVSPELKLAFFQAAASILLRPLPPAGQDPGPAGVDGKYLVIRRLLPFFEQSAPAEMVESLRGQLNALNTVASENARRRDDEWINRGIRPEKPTADRERELLDRLDRAKTSTERDGIYISLANIIARQGDLRAREFASKIEEPELRKEFGAYMDGQLVNYHVGKKQTEQALELIRKGDISHLHRAWALTRVATELVKTDRDAALQLIEEAATEARRIEVSEAGRPQGLVAVATALKTVDPSRMWDATFDAVKAANSAEGFTGEDGGLLLQFQSKHQSSVNTNDAPEFDLEGIFKELATQDYERAVELARGFEREGPRAVATIAIARAVLEPPKVTKTPNRKAAQE